KKALFRQFADGNESIDGPKTKDGINSGSLPDFNAVHDQKERGPVAASHPSCHRQQVNGTTTNSCEIVPLSEQTAELVNEVHFSGCSLCRVDKTRRKWTGVSKNAAGERCHGLYSGI